MGNIPEFSDLARPATGNAAAVRPVVGGVAITDRGTARAAL